MPSGPTGLRTVAPATLRPRHPGDGLADAARVLAGTGRAFLAEAVLHLARALPAPLVFVGELDGPTIHTAVVARHGQLAGTFTGTLARPCPAPHEPGEVVWLPDGLLDGDRRDPRRCLAVIGPDAPGAAASIVAAMVERTEDAPDAAALLALFAPRVDEVLRNGRLEARLLRDEDTRQRELVGRLAAGVAHDFNNLLMIMTGYAEMLRDRHGSSEEIGELLSAGTRASALIRQLLAYGGRQVLRAERLDLNRVIAHVEAVVSQLASPRIRLARQRSTGLPAVRGDAAQLEQAVMMLALDACDAMPDGGTLAIGSASVRVDESNDGVPAGPYVCVRVSDSGPAMSADVVARIFEPFTMRRGIRGSGLGLASVRGVVQQSGGFTRCESVPGQGTTFLLYLPAID